MNMNNIALTLLFLALPHCGISQEYPYLSGDTFYYSKDVQFVAGDTVKLGTGTMPNGFFKFITISRNSWLRAANSDVGTGNIGAKWSNQKFIIKRVYAYGNEKRGYTHYLLLNGIGTSYECDILNALPSGELLHPNYVIQSANQSALSMSDELKKLSDLYKEGVLTEDEYNKAKSKVINQ